MLRNPQGSRDAPDAPDASEMTLSPLSKPGSIYLLHHVHWYINSLAGYLNIYCKEELLLLLAASPTSSWSGDDTASSGGYRVGFSGSIDEAKTLGLPVRSPDKVDVAVDTYPRVKIDHQGLLLLLALLRGCDIATAASSLVMTLVSTAKLSTIRAEHDEMNGHACVPATESLLEKDGIKSKVQISGGCPFIVEESKASILVGEMTCFWKCATLQADLLRAGASVTKRSRMLRLRTIDTPPAKLPTGDEALRAGAKKLGSSSGMSGYAAPCLTRAKRLQSLERNKRQSGEILVLGIARNRSRATNKIACSTPLFTSEMDEADTPLDISLEEAEDSRGATSISVIVG
ncbi:hypothetical protein DFH06DRAFT_1150419 [Mycena polygramma]|nr:hypothetical protein DFH06DRAFT_1150419 [Mycena polygramma]